MFKRVFGDRPLMASIQINWYNKTGAGMTEEFKQKAANELEKILAKTQRKAIIDISLIKEAEIRTLNRKYLQNDRATDVLSFPLHRDLKAIRKAPQPLHLGEIALCPDYVGGDEEKMLFCLKHGTKHLMGQHHK